MPFNARAVAVCRTIGGQHAHCNKPPAPRGPPQCHAQCAMVRGFFHLPTRSETAEQPALPFWCIAIPIWHLTATAEPAVMWRARVVLVTEAHSPRCARCRCSISSDLPGRRWSMQDGACQTLCLTTSYSEMITRTSHGCCSSSSISPTTSAISPIMGPGSLAWSPNFVEAKASCTQRLRIEARESFVILINA